MEIVTSSAIVPEVLKKDNYIRWSILMKHYLAAQDLWDVINSSKMPRRGNMREWKKKNALALHVIGISCGTEAFDQIKKINSAKGAWDALAAMLKPPDVEAVTHDNSEHHQRGQIEHQELLKLVCCDSISSVKEFLRDHPDAKSQEMLDSALKHAITCGRKNMAHYLYRKIPLDFLQGDRGFFLLEHCITRRMFDIAWDLLRSFPELAYKNPSNSTPIILRLAETPPPFLSLSELRSWGRWIYKSNQVKALRIRPEAEPVGVGIVQNKLRKWINPVEPVLYKYHLVCLMIGVLCWMPCWLPVKTWKLGILFPLCLLFVVLLLKLDLLCVLLGVSLFLTHVSADKPDQLLIGSAVFILLLVILRVILRVIERILDRERSRIPALLRNSAQRLLKPLRMPIGVPLVLAGLPISLSVSNKRLVQPRVIFFPLFLLFIMPLLIFVIQKYKLKLMDKYALEVIRSICGSLSTLDEYQFVQSGAVEATFQAIENNIPEIVIELLKNTNGNIIWSNIDLEGSRNMFAYAVLHRQEKIARFLYDEVGARKDTNMVTATDDDGNNILHVAAQLAPQSQLNHISGAALQLQSELHWFKSVEAIVPRFYNEKNKDGETPTQVLLREHGNLLKEAEGWMKKVAESCTVVGALVITTMFAAAFTVPGGNNQGTGFPIFLNETTDPLSTVSHVALFKVFAVSDAISLFAACSSVLMFMGILTSRYACQDFHTSLPIKLIIGLSSLFISIAAMMVAFCATLYLMQEGKMRICIPITFIASIPVTLFILLQSPLLIEIYGSTFRPYFFYKRRYWKYGKRVYSSLNRRWWFRTKRGWMVVMLCALALLYIIAFSILIWKAYYRGQMIVL